jgi:hypothetical protein
MTERKRHHDRRRRFSVAPGFADDLDKLWRPEGQVPAAVDRAIAEAARRHFSRPQRRIRLSRWTIPAAAAAVIVVGASVCWLGLGLHRSRMESPASQTASGRRVAAGAAGTIDDARADIDRNGRVDILDALTMARHIDAGHPTSKLWDINGDGFVNNNDIDAVAYAAVRLDKGVGS